MKWNSFWIVTLLMVSSCSRKNQLLLPTIEINPLSSKVDTIHGSIINIEAFGAMDIYSFDNLLFIETNDNSSFLKVYSLDNYEHLADLCPSGRASNEFLNPRSVCKQLYKEGDRVMLVMTDNHITNKYIDITESILNKKTVVTKTEDALLSSRRGYCLYNNTTDEWFVYKKVSYIDPRDQIYYPPQFSFYKKNKEDEIPVFKKMMNFPEGTNYPLFIYEGDLRLKPDGSKISFTCFNMPYIFLFDTNSRNGVAIHEMGKLSYYDDYPSDDVTDIDLFYLDACVTDDYIICVCGDGKQNDYDEFKRPIIRFFNWEGECLFGFYIDQRTYAIAYDSIKKRVIGLDTRTELLYEYDVKDFIK